MDYKSLFDRLVEREGKFDYDYNLYYNGNLEEVITRVSEELGRCSPNLYNLILDPPRIIRAFVNYKIENPWAFEAESLIKSSINLGLDIYKCEPCTAEELFELKDWTIKTGNGSLLRNPLIQPADSTTWKSTFPGRSDKTARYLTEQLEKKPVLFIALSHGGVAAGMDVYLRYCDSMMDGKEGKSVFYTARLSTDKSNDAFPCLSDNEKRYLKDKSIGRKIVIFDEDSFSGVTLKRAKRFFSDEVFNGKSLETVANFYGNASR
jgi:hypothetical protein